MRKLVLISVIFSVASVAFSLGTVIERNGLTITFDVDARGVETVAVDFFQENGITARLKSIYGHYYLELQVSRDYFVEIDELSVSLVASKELMSYSERYTDITAFAKKTFFVDKAKDTDGRNPFVYYKEMSNGMYNTTFSVQLPNNKESVLTYLKELKIHAVLGKESIGITASPEAVRIIQDFGIIIFSDLR